MKKDLPRMLGLDVISSPKLIGLSPCQSSYTVTTFDAINNVVSKHAVAIALPDTLLLQVSVSREKALSHFQSQYMIDTREHQENQLLVTAVMPEILARSLEKVKSRNVSVVDAESACIQRLLQKLFQIDESVYLVLMIDQTEFRLYLLKDSLLQFKYREVLYENVADAFKRCFEFLKALSGFMGADRCYLAGNHDQLPLFVDVITQLIQLSVFLINPFSKLIFPSTINSATYMMEGPSYAVACGLALRGHEDD